MRTSQKEMRQRRDIWLEEQRTTVLILICVLSYQEMFHWEKGAFMGHSSLASPGMSMLSVNRESFLNPTSRLICCPHHLRGSICSGCTYRLSFGAVYVSLDVCGTLVQCKDPVHWSREGRGGIKRSH